MKNLLFLAFFVALPAQVLAQIQIKNDQNIDKLVKEIFLKGGVEVSNIQFSGNLEAIAYFDSQIDTLMMPIKKGIILSTGKAFSLAGLNHSPSTSTNFSGSGDADLDRISRDSTHDAAVLEFDFVPKSNKISFNYIFTSEEYIEFVGSPYNDVFAFFIQQKNDSKVKNIGVLPTNKAPVTVNNVNHRLNNRFYINNSPVPLTRIAQKCFDRKGRIKKKYRTQLLLEEIPFEQRAYTVLSKNIQMDGLTVRLTAQTDVVANEMYHIKIAIADVHDHIFDSGVLLEAESFVSFEDTLQLPDNELVVKNENLIDIKKSEKETPQIVKKIEKETPQIVKKIEKEVVKEEPKKENTYQAPPQTPRTFSKKVIHFAFDSYTIDAENQKIVSEIYQILSENQHLKLRIQGHTDFLGSENYNLELSQKRIQAVVSFLESLGKVQISEQIGKGESQPLADNQTDKGRQKNRRVELIFE